jgi:hypothetical protein
MLLMSGSVWINISTHKINAQLTKHFFKTLYNFLVFLRLVCAHTHLQQT